MKQIFPSIITHQEAVKDINSVTFSESSDIENSSKIVLGCFEGPFKPKGLTLYWEGIIEARKLILSLTIFINNIQLQLLLCLMICVLILIHHMKCCPFKENSSNWCETFSLCLLILFSLINFEKAFLSEYEFEEDSKGAKAMFFMLIAEPLLLIILAMYIAATKICTTMFIKFN